MRRLLVVMAVLLIAASVAGPATAQVNPYYQQDPQWQPWQQVQPPGFIPTIPRYQQPQTNVIQGTSVGAWYLNLTGTVDPIGMMFAPSALQWGLMIDGGRAWSLEYRYVAPQHGGQTFHLEKEVQMLGYKWDQDVRLDASASHHHLSLTGPRIIVRNSNLGLRPTILGQWWGAKIELQKTGTSASTGTADRPRIADWTSRQALIGGGVTVDYPITSMLSVKCLGAYLGGGSAGGALFDAGVTVTWNPVAIEAGYLYRQAKWAADGLDMQFGANTPYVGLRLGFQL